MREKIFKWNNQIPIQLMRIEALGKLYGYCTHNHDELVFKIVPIGGYRGSGKMLNALRMKHKWTQFQAGEKLGVSQSLIAKYESGDKVMPHRIVFEIQHQNADETLYKSWRNFPVREKIFKWNKGHIASMRIEAQGKLYGYNYHKDNEMIFKVGQKRRNDGRGKSLKELRKKLHWTQAQAGKELGASQTAIAKYESGDRIMPTHIARKVNVKNWGLTAHEIKQLALLQKWPLDDLKKILAWMGYTKNIGTII